MPNWVSAPVQVLGGEEEPRQGKPPSFPCRHHGPTAQPSRSAGVSRRHPCPVSASGHGTAAEELASARQVHCQGPNAPHALDGRRPAFLHNRPSFFGVPLRYSQILESALNGEAHSECPLLQSLDKVGTVAQHTALDPVGDQIVRVTQGADQALDFLHRLDQSAGRTFGPPGKVIHPTSGVAAVKSAPRLHNPWHHDKSEHVHSRRASRRDASRWHMHRSHGTVHFEVPRCGVHVQQGLKDPCRHSGGLQGRAHITEP